MSNPHGPYCCRHVEEMNHGGSCSPRCRFGYAPSEDWEAPKGFYVGEKFPGHHAVSVICQGSVSTVDFGLDL